MRCTVSRVVLQVMEHIDGRYWKTAAARAVPLPVKHGIVRCPRCHPGYIPVYP